MIRNQNLMNDFAQKNYYSSNNNMNLDVYVNKINELNDILSREMNNNQVFVFLYKFKLENLIRFWKKNAMII